MPAPRRPRHVRAATAAAAPGPAGLTAPARARRYYHPAPPARAIVKAERTFEGISLDTPGTSGRQVAAMSRFQLCPACYEAEAGCALRRARPVAPVLDAPVLDAPGRQLAAPCASCQAL